MNKTLFQSLRVFFVASGIILTGCHDTPEAANAIIDAHAEVCQSSGMSWTKRALLQANQLEQLFETLKSRPGCENLSSVIEQLHRVSGDIHKLVRDESFQ